MSQRAGMGNIGVWSENSKAMSKEGCYDVVQCTALLNLELRRVQTLASAHALCLTTSYSYLSISGVFRDSKDFQKCQKVVPGVLEVKSRTGV